MVDKGGAVAFSAVFLQANSTSIEVAPVKGCMIIPHVMIAIQYGASPESEKI